MQLLRFHKPGAGPRLGALIEGADGARTVYDLSAGEVPQLADMSALLQASLEAPLAGWLAQADLSSLPTMPYAQLDVPPVPGGLYLLPPIDRQEVWAAGVTYVRSRQARMEESATADIYARVYDAERPELFFKSTADRCVGPHDWIGVRGDSAWNVPEPELALVLNPKMQIVGYSVGNDVSSRDIEGENPLYLPQAKVYRHSCALGPVITVADERINATDLDIALQILRGGEVVFQGSTNTSQIHRRLEQLAEYLGRYYDFPYGAVLLTGTCIVPGDAFTLTDGDEVVIEIEGIGTLRNPVKQM